MKFDPRDSLKTTCYGLIFIWGAGTLGLALTSGNMYMGGFYAVIVGPIMFLIYQTAKAERNDELCHKKNSHRHLWERKGCPPAHHDNQKNQEQ